MNTRDETAGKLFFSIEELKNQGLSNYRINQWVAEGKLKRLTRTVYENLQFQGERHEFFYAPVFAPKGIVCLMSAAVFWQLSTYRPLAVDVAIPRNRKLYTLPEWPVFSIHYFDINRHRLGSQVVQTEEQSFSVTDPEKTALDVLHFKENIGIEQVREVMALYLQRKDRDLNKLYNYASKLKTTSILRTYMEMML